MWNLCASSKIIDTRIRQRSYQIHQQKLDRMRPKMKIVAPAQPDFVYIKAKQEMTRHDRLREIDHQNEILLTKMNKISEAQYTTNKLRPQAQNLKTLNRHIVNTQAEGIYNQNKRICQKLMSVNSYYPTFDIIDRSQALEKVRVNISENARRAQSAANLRPQSSQTNRSSRFYRSKVAKFDAAGNSSDQKAFKIYQLASQSSLRPESAPANRKKARPYSSERNSKSRKTVGNNAEEEEVRGKVRRYQQV